MLPAAQGSPAAAAARYLAFCRDHSFPHHLLKARRTAASQAAQESAPSTSTSDAPLNPWAFGFQVSERKLEWGSVAQRQLLKMHAADSLGKDIEWVEDRLERLLGIVPDLMGRMDQMKADMLLTLVANCEGIAVKAVQLKTLLPNSDVSHLISKSPALLLNLRMNDIRANLDKMREAFGPDTDVEAIITREPALLSADIHDLSSEIMRLMPGTADPIAFIAANPSIVLDMGLAGLPSTIDGDLTSEPSIF
ncbi:hypothetical protein WJX73_009451 [Symbiochloris irregularis]|uniref:Uncharacterized protein n=1 Tax=Symbiochloris irregularis TaxID=706552 RepID=A0AAW1NYZ6_9CHLO